MKTLYLLDAYALIYRAYYGLIRSPRINSKGQNTSAVFGFVNTLREVLEKGQPDYIAVVFDPPGGTFRHDAYPDYKAQREATPEDIRFAVPYIKKLVKAYRIPLLEQPGYEADDVIGTVAKAGAKAGLEVTMITPDKDYAQLVQAGITMCRPSSGANKWEMLGPDEVCEKYNLSSPSQMIDYLALVGDTADNIPGCRGVGPKTAEKLLKEYEDVEHLLEHTNDLRGKLQSSIVSHAEEIRFSKFLVTIKTDVPFSWNWEDLRYEEPDEVALQEIFEELEFRSLLKKLDLPANSGQNVPIQRSLFDEIPVENTGTMEKSPKNVQKSPNNSVQYIDSQGDVQNICVALSKCRKIGISIFLSENDVMLAQLQGIGLCDADGNGYYLNVPRGTQEADLFFQSIRPLLSNEQILKVGHDLKTIVMALSRQSITLQGPFFDTQLAHYLIQPELKHELDFLADVYLHEPFSLDVLREKKKEGEVLVREEEWRTVGHAASIAMNLETILRKELKENGVSKLYDEIEIPLMQVLANMELQGVSLDVSILKDVEVGFNERLHVLEQEIYALAGHEFLISSPKQVGEVLFAELQLKEKPKKTKTGSYQTGEEVLKEIAAVHPIVNKILAHRGLKKLLSTYVLALPKLINPYTKHLHTSFNQTVTATGRLSSSNPNLQNIPVRGDDGKEIRKAFVPEPGEVFLSADYSQIELRIMAHISGDEHMIAAFNAGKDIHAATAARIFKKPLEEITADERRKAKTANFGIIYGISAFGLSERLQISRTEAKELIDSYFEMFPQIANYMNTAVEDARKKGYIETLYGRRRYLADIDSRNGVVRGYAERNAINAPIQGTAADIIKIAMIRVQKRLEREHLKAKMLLQVHDELNFSVPKEELEVVKRLVKEEMEQAIHLKVPLIADCGVGENWLEAH